MKRLSMRPSVGPKQVACSAVLLLSMAGCRTAPVVDDPTLTAQVQQRLAADSSISSEPVQILAHAGIVTLTGAVSNPAARTLAANDAAGVAGVKQVMNDITVNPATAPASALSTTPLQPAEPIQTSRTREIVRAAPPVREAAPISRTPAPSSAPAQSYGPPPVASQPSTPPPPVARVVTLPAGSTLPVRITQTLDSATSQPGDTFSGALATDLIADGMVLVARGANVNGRVSEVHEAAHFKGAALLTVELTGLTARGERITVSTQPYSVEGKGRGKNTAVKTGVGAAAGAVLGGIFGGGKGAAIGAAAGGGTGAAVNGVTRGEQVQIPSESVVRFVTTNAIAVRTSVHAGAGAQNDPSLQTR